MPIKLELTSRTVLISIGTRPRPRFRTSSTTRARCINRWSTTSRTLMSLKRFKLTNKSSWSNVIWSISFTCIISSFRISARILALVLRCPNGLAKIFTIKCLTHERSSIVSPTILLCLNWPWSYSSSAWICPCLVRLIIGMTSETRRKSFSIRTSTLHYCGSIWITYSKKTKQLDQCKSSSCRSYVIKHWCVDSRRCSVETALRMYSIHWCDRSFA